MRYANWIVAAVAGVCLSLAGSSFAQIRTENNKEDPDFPLRKAFGDLPEADASKSKDDAKARAKSRPTAPERGLQEERREPRRVTGADTDAGVAPLPAGTSKNSSLMLRSSQVLGMPLWNEDGQSIGKVVDVVGDAGGQSQFAVVSLKGDERMIVLPYSGLRFQVGSRGDNHALLRIAPTQLKNAPSFIGDEWPAFTSKYSGWVTKFYSDLVPIPGTTQRGRIPSAVRDNDAAEPGLSEASSAYPNPTPHSVDGTPRTATGAAPSGAPLPDEPIRPSTSRPGAGLPGAENRGVPSRLGFQGARPRAHRETLQERQHLAGLALGAPCLVGREGLLEGPVPGAQRVEQVAAGVVGQAPAVPKPFRLASMDQLADCG